MVVKTQRIRWRCRTRGCQSKKRLLSNKCPKCLFVNWMGWGDNRKVPKLLTNRPALQQQQKTQSADVHRRLKEQYYLCLTLAEGVLLLLLLHIIHLQKARYKKITKRNILFCHRRIISRTIPPTNDAIHAKGCRGRRMHEVRGPAGTWAPKRMVCHRWSIWLGWLRSRICLRL